MARLTNGILGPLIGKLANVVGYIRLGAPVIRMQPKKLKKKKARTEAQLAVNLKFKIVKSFLARINAFINTGFRMEVAGTTRIPENAAVSYNIKNAVVGEYPDLILDFSKVVISKGSLPAPSNPLVTLEGNFIKFKWDVDADWSYKLKRDQVMMLAYLPANKRAYYTLSSARRSIGEDLLEIRTVAVAKGGAKKDEVIETYIAFIADDRQSISDSVYAGRIIL